MITINDDKKLLNLNHLAIYLMLTPEEMALHGEKLKTLNRYTSLTRKLFRFEIIGKGNATYGELPKEMARNMRHYNVLVRLVNSIHGIYCYGLEEIDLTADVNAMVDELKAFVDGVCKEDINQLDILSNRVTSTSVSAMKEYRENNLVKEVFEAALNNEDTDTARVKQLMAMRSSDMVTSLGLAAAAVDDKLASKIEKERCERERPFERPDIRMNVSSHVKTGKVFKNGREQRKLGVEIIINGVSVPVWFGTTDRDFLYIIILMACLEGRTIKRSDFIEPNRNDVKKMGEYQEFINWLLPRFQALKFDRRFDKWNLGVKADPHPLDVAMGSIKKTLWNFLGLQFKDAYYYCIPVNENGRYRIRGVNKDRISIDQSILDAIEE